MMENKKSDGSFSIEYIFRQCFMRKHMLRVELYNPICIKGNEVSRICIKEIAESDEAKEDLLKRALNCENNDGTILVKAYIDSPFDTEDIIVNNRNIVSIEQYRY